MTLSVTARVADQGQLTGTSGGGVRIAVAVACAVGLAVWATDGPPGAYGFRTGSTSRTVSARLAHSLDFVR